MKRKVALIAAAALLTTATIVTATTVSTSKKAVGGQPVKTETAGEKKSECSYKRTHCFD